MSNKAAAQWHGVTCGGECCRTNKHLGVCPHARVCTFHLAEEVQRIKADREASARLEAFKPWR